MSHKAPSEGRKVDLGQNAPTKVEGTGAVASDSLAAESKREGGEFASNPSGRSENVSASGNSSFNVNTSTTSTSTSSGRTQNTGSSNTGSSNTGSSNTDSSNTDSSAAASAGTAPSYVNAQYIKASGPHGKNITEGFDDSKTEDGLKKALNSEPGSMDDPSRQAELQFQLNQNAQSRGAGPKQGGLTNETKFDTLDSNASA